MARGINEIEKDPNKLHGKHPRRLQFERQRSGVVTSYEAWIAEKITLDRKLLKVGLTEGGRHRSGSQAARRDSQ